MTRLAPAAATSRRIAWSLVTTTTGRLDRRGVDLGADDVVGDHAGRRVHDAGQAPPRCVGADDVGAVEHDRDVGARSRRARSSTRSRHRVRWRLEVVGGPGQLGDVVAVDEHQRMPAPAAGARSPCGSRGRRRPATAGRPARSVPTSTGGSGGRPRPAPSGPARAARSPGRPTRRSRCARRGRRAARRAGPRPSRRAAARRRARPRRRRAWRGPPRRGRWRGGRRGGLGRLGPQRVDLGAGTAAGAAGRLELLLQLVDPGLQRDAARRGCGPPPARRPRAGARPAAARRRRRPASAAASAAATSSATR